VCLLRGTDWIFYTVIIHVNLRPYGVKNQTLTEEACAVSYNNNNNNNDNNNNNNSC